MFSLFASLIGLKISCYGFTSEQSAGVAQVGEAVTQMDHATQQNAALVEQMAAAASALKAQAGDLVQTVAVFKLGAGETVAKSTVRSAVPAITPFKGDERRTATASKKQNMVVARAPKAQPASPPELTTLAKVTSTKSDDDWETF